VKGKRYKVAFSIVLFQSYFNQFIVFYSFKINVFSLIVYAELKCPKTDGIACPDIAGI